MTKAPYLVKNHYDGGGYGYSYNTFKRVSFTGKFKTIRGGPDNQNTLMIQIKKTILGIKIGTSWVNSNDIAILDAEITEEYN